MSLYLYGGKIKNFVLDLLFPVKCLGCDMKNEVLCDYCISKIHRNDRETENNITAMFDYREPLVRKVIWELKYHHKRYLAEKLGQLLYEFMMEDISDMKMEVSGRAIFVIPVPISGKKTKLRGYNQSLAIAKGFCRLREPGIFEIKDNIIFKKVDTLPQARITNRKRRLENVRGVFDIKNKDVIKGRTIIVMDDVTTTGGTINEVMKILKKAGAKNIVGFAVAH
jgi:ComF family protein